mmetsp:Transcript_40772/g.62708  ORF Transcript_40772/g.62708 Transcript_40772/m.62708 type:complete len:351 (-) Transcript_40772:3275-4327(-)
MSFLFFCSAVLFSVARGFVPQATPIISSTKLGAVGSLVKKAKEASLREYIAAGVEEEVMEKYNIIREALQRDEFDFDNRGELPPLQERLTRRKGTITVIPEYKRKSSDSGYIQGILEPEILSGEFREFGAHAVAVMCDERMGGCTYDDLKAIVEDQRRAKVEVPGPLHVINNDVIIDELQIARTAAYGANAVVVNLALNGVEGTTKLLKAAHALSLETVVAISSKDEAQQAIDVGARIISVVNVEGAAAKKEVITGLQIPEGEVVTTIANILHRLDKGLAEVEEAWECRDIGFNCAWVSDALYKAGNSVNEHPGAIIKSMSAKSSVRWASPVARGGRGEGAREYLGDILM